MGIYVLSGTLLIIFLINVKVNNKYFGAPAVVFSFAFLLSSVWACAFSRKWDLNLHRNTFIVIFMGVLLFSIVCLFTRYFDDTFYATRSKQNKINNIIMIDNRKVFVFIIFELMIIVYYVKVILGATGEKNLSNAIVKIYNGTSEIDLPFGVRQALSLMRASSYWFSFILTNNYLINKKIQWLLAIAIGMAAISTMFTGSRGVMICIALSIPAFMLLINYRKNRHRGKIGIKKIMFSFLIFGFTIWCFPRMGDLLGRTTTIEPMEYIAAYLGAEIKNLDLFLSDSKVPVNSGTWGSSVFYSLEKTLNKYFKFSLQIQSESYPYNRVNGYFLGNVYTIFYELLYDFGYIGNYLVIIVLALINQKVFDCAEKKKIRNTVPVVIIIYGYMFPLILLSFFAWWFGNYVISTSFLYNIFYWNFLNFIFFKIKSLPKIRNIFKLV